MAIAIYFPDSVMTEEEYTNIDRTLAERGLGAPRGREYHVAFNRPDGTTTVVDVWDSEEHLGEFVEKLMPIVGEFGYNPGEPQIYEVSNIIVGS